MRRRFLFFCPEIGLNRPKILATPQNFLHCQGKYFIVPRSYDLLAVKQAMGRAGLQLLRRIVDNKQVIEPAWGISIREFTRHDQNSKVPQIDSDFVLLDGDPENIDSELHFNTLCYELSWAFGGRCHYIYAPVITHTAEINE
ncbi:MAG: hypothetical protein IJK81_02420 [Selenomonadaceae bacterium]|nr:hypothetical protein [Selenomonadaceae bacterium]